MYGGPPHHQPFGGPPPMYGGGPPGDGRTAKWGRYDVGADTTSGDTICFLKLPRGATDAMILELTGQLPGYLTMNFVPGTGAGPVAFVLFQDAAHAQEALNALQGRTICDQPVLAQIARRSLARESRQSGGGGGGVGGGGATGGQLGAEVASAYGADSAMDAPKP